MPSEARLLNSVPQNKSIESLKETFRQRLDGILNEQLTVENIEYFGSDALNKTINLTDDILKEYKSNQNFHANLNSSAREQEDEAFKTLGLPDIQNILQSIVEVKDKIAALKEYLETNTEASDKVITPPQENHTVIIPGENNFKEKKLFPRLLTLMYILEHDFEIQKEDVKIVEGKITPDMMRKTPYMRVEIPDLKRLVYICDEEDNVSYVFDTDKLTEKSLSFEEIDKDNKKFKDSLIEKHPGIGIRIIQTKNWRTRIKIALEELIPEIQKEESGNEREKISEFLEKKEWLLFEDFQAEVRALYPGKGKGDVKKWHIEERKKHSNWHSRPDIIYKGKGWEGWSELVGIENRLKKEWFPFENFQAEVRALYPGKGGVKKWYREERKKHSNWYSNPDIIYKGKGWEGWSKLVV